MSDRTTAAPVRAAACPLCGGPNGCVPAARGDFDGRCWCEDATFGPAALDAIPPPSRGRACVCRSCALGRNLIRPQP